MALVAPACLCLQQLDAVDGACRHFAIDPNWVQETLKRCLSPCCMCCTPTSKSVRFSNPSVEPGIHVLPSDTRMQVLADPGTLADTAENVEVALLRVFDVEGVRTLFGCGANGAQRLRGSGMNHIVMVVQAGRLAKCVRPPSPELSELLEAWRLRTASPWIVEDIHALFPLAAFSCRESSLNASVGVRPCEVLVYDYLKDSSSVAELIRIYEQTHPMGMLRKSATCAEHRHGASCAHARQLLVLVSKQVPLLNQRFQALYGQRHGDFKAANVLVDHSGIPRVADFLSPWCQTCDREEFLGSLASMHPTVQEIRNATADNWQLSRNIRFEVNSIALRPEAIAANAWLIQSLQKLNASRPTQAQSIFGPVPSLFEQIGWSSAANVPALSKPDALIT